MSRKSKVTKGDLMEVVVDRSLLEKESWGGRLLPGTGTILFQDDFHGFHHWIPSGVTSNIAYRDPTRSFIGEASMRVKSGGTDLYAEAFLPAGPIGTYGIDLHFLLEATNTLEYIRFAFDFDGDAKSGYHASEAKFVVESIDTISAPTHYRINGKWQYLSEANTNIDIPNGEMSFRTYEVTHGNRKYTRFWHRLKLIIDFENQKYVSLQVRDKKFDLSNFKTRKTFGAPFNTMSFPILLRVKATTGNEYSVWFDAFMLTLEE